MTNATITSIRDRKYPEKYIANGCNVFVKSNVNDIVDAWFSENKIWELEFKCKAWTKLKNAANKLNIAAIRTVYGFNCDITYSQYAGCSSCPCSPGFRVRKFTGGHRRVNCDVWMNIQADASALVEMLTKCSEMLKKEIELNTAVA